jgi:glucose/arabinose dehydrogenase
MLSGRIGAIACIAVLVAGCGSSPRHPASPRLVSIGGGLKGPAGLAASVYARGLPTVAAFTLDPQGRLWAAAAGLGAHSGDGVYLIAKAGTTPKRVITGLDDPLGLTWYHGRLYVASVGRVTVYAGFTGTRFLQRRTLIRGPLAHGENNDLVLAPDGRFVMGITANCDHCRPRSKYAGSIVSFRPDGTDLRVYASRIRAPVGLAYYPGTSDLFATINQRGDLGARTPGDWLAVVPPGTNWRFPECYGQAGAVCAAVPRPLAVLDPHAAVGSVVILTGRLGPAAGTAALVSEWNTAKVVRVALTRRGTGFAGTTSLWLRGLHNPLALASGRDGSVLVGDWGTGIIYAIRAGGA